MSEAGKRFVVAAEEVREMVKGKRFPLSFKTTGTLRRALDVAAAESGRSLAQEVEFRLECSFRESQIDNLQRQIDDLDAQVDEINSFLVR